MAIKLQRKRAKVEKDDKMSFGNRVPTNVNNIRECKREEHRVSISLLKGLSEGGTRVQDDEKRVTEGADDDDDTKHFDIPEK
jgi:hypothetical protein